MSGGDVRQDPNPEEDRAMDFLTLPERTTKPRQSGITHVLDKGLGPAQVTDLLDVAADYIDIVKLGWGTAAVTPNLDEKIDRYQSHGIPVCFGGTLFEVCLRQNKLDEFLATVRGYGMDCIEVSDGTIDIPRDEKLALLRKLSREFRVLSEVGSKDDAVVIAPNKWVEMIERELEAGAWKVVTEGRESGTVGIYQSSGEIKAGLMDEIVQRVDPERLLFEAPVKKQQVWFVKKFGANVNLGNIPPEEVISVETIRLGVRGDTLLDFH
jgi:phosphosulfolactate synthase